MDNKKNTYGLLVLVLVLLVGILLIYLKLPNLSQVKIDYDTQVKYASELKDNKLYKEAIEEYDKILNHLSLDKNNQANLNYIIGNLYFENLKDYEKAASRYIKARMLNPKGNLVSDINKKLIACYENLGRSLDAQRELESATALNKPKKEKPSKE